MSTPGIFARGGPIPLPPGSASATASRLSRRRDRRYPLCGSSGGRPTSRRTNVPAGAKPGGSLSDLIPGGLGGLLGGAAAGSVLSGGLGNLIKELQEGGHGRVAQSWVGTGPNQDIAPQHLADALGSDTLDALSQHTGMGRADLLAGLSQHLPDLIDQLTPNGRLPSEEEAHRMV